MTLPDLMEQIESMREKKPVDTGVALQESLIQALDEDLLIVGTYQCAKFMETNPENVMFCILPDSPSSCDAMDNIQQKLIEAFCWENEIRLLKVADISKMEGMLLNNSLKGVDAYSGSANLNCIVVQFPVDRHISKPEAHVLEFYHDMMGSDMYPIPAINIPG